MKKYLLGAAAVFAAWLQRLFPVQPRHWMESWRGSIACSATTKLCTAITKICTATTRRCRRKLPLFGRRERRSTPVQALAPRNAPSRALAPAASSAMAASFPVKGAYVEPPRAFSWSGFYMGVHGGYGWGSSDWTSSTNAFAENPRSKGFLGGFQGGANYQFGNWVAGIEADFSLIDANATATNSIALFTATARSQIDWLATFTGRFGYTSTARCST